MTTPTPAPAPMTTSLAARLRELMEEATEGEYSPQKMVALQMFMGFNAPTILRLLEAVEGAEKALAGLEEAATVANTRHGADRDKSLDRAIIAARSALATLRAAREVKP